VANPSTNAKVTFAVLMIVRTSNQIRNNIVTHVDAKSVTTKHKNSIVARNYVQITVVVIQNPTTKNGAKHANHGTKIVHGAKVVYGQFILRGNVLIVVGFWDAKTRKNVQTIVPFTNVPRTVAVAKSTKVVTTVTNMYVRTQEHPLLDTPHASVNVITVQEVSVVGVVSVSLLMLSINVRHVDGTKQFAPMVACFLDVPNTKKMAKLIANLICALYAKSPM